MSLKKAVLVLLVLPFATCNQVILTAPPGSTIQLTANPPFIAANGDVSVISALVLEPAGTVVPDGTVVQFFTTLGRIDEQGKTNDGVARVNLVSDSRSGKATVTATSGGEAVTPPTTTAVAPPPGGLASAMSVTGASAVSATQATANIQVVIGSARPTLVVVSSDRPRIVTGGGTRILARVFDEFGNPVPNVPVIFTLTINGALAQLDSRGDAMFTDNDGRVSDTLRTNSLLNGFVTVRATTPNGKFGEVTVAIN